MLLLLSLLLLLLLTAAAAADSIDKYDYVAAASAAAGRSTDTFQHYDFPIAVLPLLSTASVFCWLLTINQQLKLSLPFTPESE